jgi:hypothetical protein
MRFYNVAYLQVMVEFQNGELPTLGPLLSPNMWYPILGDFEESAQEPTVCFSRQPATQSTRSSDSQFNEADSSNESTEATADFDTVFSH